MKTNTKPKPTNTEIIQVLKSLAFTVEMFAHLQGRERDLLPIAYAGRSLIDRLEGKGV
jgi:hypothetical protein